MKNIGIIEVAEVLVIIDREKRILSLSQGDLISKFTMLDVLQEIEDIFNREVAK